MKEGYKPIAKIEIMKDDRDIISDLLVYGYERIKEERNKFVILHDHDKALELSKKIKKAEYAIHYLIDQLYGLQFLDKGDK